MSKQTVEELLAEIQRERERTAIAQQEKLRLMNCVEEEKVKQNILQSNITKVQRHKDAVAKEVAKLQDNPLTLTQKNHEYVQQIEIALSDVQYGDMSLGDLYRLSSIYLNELNRVNGMISKLTNKQ